MNLLGGTAPDPQQPATSQPEQTKVCFSLHWAVVLTASCFPQTQASQNLSYIKTGPVLQHKEKEMNASPLLSQLPRGEGGCTLERNFPWLHSCSSMWMLLQLGDGDVNQFPAERKGCCLSVGLQGGLER